MSTKLITVTLRAVTGITLKKDGELYYKVEKIRHTNISLDLPVTLSDKLFCR